MFRILKQPSMTLSVALGVVFVMVFFYNFQDFSDVDPPFLQVNVRNYVIHEKLPNRSLSRYNYFWHQCQQNTSAANISGFSSLPGNIQDVIYYQHCRHFPMLLDIPDKCGGVDGSVQVFLLLVIKSSATNYDRREVLRKTWAEERLYRGVWIQRLFISGTMGSGFEKERLNQLLQMEQRKYNDILQWDFNDSFYNLTLKQMLFLEWMERNCPHARFLLNGDDDVFAHTDNMVVYLQNLKDNNGSEHLFTGHLISSVGPIRQPNSKYYVPVQLYESHSYPAYCGGGGFLLSGYTAMVIYNMSHSIPLLPIDDAYMGMCLAKAGLKPESHAGVRTAGLHLRGKKVDIYNPCYYREMILVHRFLSVNMYVMWNRLHDPKLNCSTQDQI
ncbi:N-acetyllactosaminide beta-1,3-N-acetylglucosaminyltransferase 3 [Nothobranchius furzeri]|uniref:Hexosyltransferase n=1 Tax=Nothobranchius furzeri TaxID=105023 RepID=A0A9D3BFK9_NOTFU|nr:3-N-acetylglucosaminyltransferase 3-like [Nothobranchius furzeri]